MVSWGRNIGAKTTFDTLWNEYEHAFQLEDSRSLFIDANHRQDQKAAARIAI